MGGSLRQVAASTLVQDVPAHARAADGSDPTCTISRCPRRLSTSAMICSHILVFLPLRCRSFFGPQVFRGDACACTRHGASGACTIYRRREPECCTDNFADPARGNHSEPRSRTTGIRKIDCLPWPRCLDSRTRGGIEPACVSVPVTRAWLHQCVDDCAC